MVYHRPGLGGWGWLLVRIEGNKLFMVIHGDETSLIPYVSGQPVSNSFGWQLKPFFIISPDFFGEIIQFDLHIFFVQMGWSETTNFFFFYLGRKERQFGKLGGGGLVGFWGWEVARRTKQFLRDFFLGLGKNEALKL